MSRLVSFMVDRSVPLQALHDLHGRQVFGLWFPFKPFMFFMVRRFGFLGFVEFVEFVEFVGPLRFVVYEGLRRTNIRPNRTPRTLPARTPYARS